MIAHAGALGLGIEARGTDRFPAIEHDGSPGFLGLNLEAHDIAPSALVTDGRDHVTRSSVAAEGCATSPGGFPYSTKPLNLGLCLFRLRRAADQFPRARWEPSNEHLVIMSGDTLIGLLKKQTGGTISDRWAWSITCVLSDPGESPRNGWAATRDEAQQQLADAWRAWLARTGLQETWTPPGSGL